LGPTTPARRKLNIKSLGDDGAAFVAAVLVGNTVLTDLNLGSNSIGDAGAASLADALKANNVLISLNLAWNNIGGTGAARLVDALMVNNVLTYLELDSNKIRDDGAARLADGLKVNNVFIRLGLGGNIIYSTTADNIETCLQRNKDHRPTAVTVASEAVAAKALTQPQPSTLPPSAPVFAASMEQHPNWSKLHKDVQRILWVLWANGAGTTEVDFSHKSLGDDGAEFVAAGLVGNAVLTTLSLYKNSIGHSGAASLVDALKVNNVLTSFDLNSNKIRDSAANDNIETFLQRNKDRSAAAAPATEAVAAKASTAAREKEVVKQ
jgi:hypothetical protein